jgi:hypothetical protein
MATAGTVTLAVIVKNLADRAIANEPQQSPSPSTRSAKASK